MVFAVTQEVFAGPLGLLLQLIEAEELSITKVSLAQVADDYLRYLEQHDVPADELADFLVIAARLIYVKSRELMPYLKIADEEEGIERLEEQLRLYKEYAAAAQKLQIIYAKERLFVRPFVRTQNVAAAFVPADNVTTEALVDAFRSVLKRLEPFFALKEASMTRAKSVEERIEELTGALRSRSTMSFKEVVAGATDKMEVVVSFLALLELLRRRVIHASQTSAFGEIELKRAQG